jgi:hypothetical protein
VTAARKAELLRSRYAIEQSLSIARRALGNHVAKKTINSARIEFWREVVRILSEPEAK